MEDNEINRMLLGEILSADYIICSDIENFKLVNDVFGLPAGDRLLREAADFYQSQVGDKGICGHFNGDPVGKGEDICRSIREYPFAGKVRACCSAGFVTWDIREPLSAILEHADQALYRAKAEKRAAAVCGKPV